MGGAGSLPAEDRTRLSALWPRQGHASRCGTKPVSLEGILARRNAIGRGGYADLRPRQFWGVGNVSWEAVNWATRQTTGDGQTKAILVLLANWADVDGNLKQVRANYLSKVSELSERTIYRRLKDLEEKGLLTREWAGHKSSGAPLVTGRLHLDVEYDDSVVNAGTFRKSEDAVGDTDDQGGDCLIDSPWGGGTVQ